MINARNRLNIRINKAFTFGEIQTATHFYKKYNTTFDIEFRLKELYLDIFTTNYDLRIGFQRLTTGRSDAGFGTLLTSVFTSTATMGLMFCTTIFAALIVDLFVHSSLFYRLKPDLTKLI